MQAFVFYFSFFLCAIPDTFLCERKGENCNFLMENSLFMFFCALFFHMNKLENTMKEKSMLE